MQRRQLPITFKRAGVTLESVTETVQVGPYLLSVQTVLPQAGLAVELQSSFVAHSATATHATHLLLGPIGHPPHLATEADVWTIAHPMTRPDSCVYAHCHELIALLAQRGVDLTVDQLPSRPLALPL